MSYGFLRAPFGPPVHNAWTQPHVIRILAILAHGPAIFIGYHSTPGQL